MNSTSPLPRAVRTAARSPARSMAGPEVVRICAPISAATMFASVVLPSPGRSVEKHVVDRLVAVACRVDEDAEVLLDAILPGELVETARADGRLDGQLLLGDLGARDALDRHRGRSTVESNMCPILPMRSQRQVIGPRLQRAAATAGPPRDASTTPPTPMRPTPAPGAGAPRRPVAASTSMAVSGYEVGGSSHGHSRGSPCQRLGDPGQGLGRACRARASGTDR